MIYPPSLSNLINYFRKLPGIGEKSAERLALSLIELSDDDVNKFASSMMDSKKNLHACRICGHISDKDECDICSDKTAGRNASRHEYAIRSRLMGVLSDHRDHRVRDLLKYFTDK